MHGEPGRVEMSDALRESGLIAVLRAASVRDCVGAMSALTGAGIRVIELTLTIPDLADGLADVIAANPSAEVGVGTITTPEQVHAVADRGARFIVTPTVNPAVVRAAADLSLPCYPGGMTPSEIHANWSEGATAIKLFPASTVGAPYIGHIHGPFPEIPLIPSGGIGITDVAEWIRAGAAAVSLGSPLLGDALSGGDLDALYERAERALAEVQRARHE